MRVNQASIAAPAATHAGDESFDRPFRVHWLANKISTLMHDQPDGFTGEKSITADDEGQVRLTLKSLRGAILISD